MAIPRITTPVLPFIRLRRSIRSTTLDVDDLRARVAALTEQSRRLTENVRVLREQTARHLELVTRHLDSVKNVSAAVDAKQSKK